ncbi:caspase family protein [Lichenifustis flavocetrariae]|uniref:Caspase family protein n=1 Tax=Lichenifustis flavocetrariae TaxID=2949735 RepID=A0AA41YQA7_9HYPH|nr:caspase family protein [Lichenifustis flavocetrariae]MCW6506599.1 caspase family protein [Lichenifustis flavocetrariae]
MRSAAWLCLACVTPAQAAEPHRVALVVGIGAYQHLPALPNTVGDARLIADKLRATGFDVDLETDLTKDQLTHVVRDFAHKVEAAGPDAVSAFYYAGHGIQDDKQANFLIGVDAEVKSQVDLPFEALPLDRTLETFEAAHPAVTLVMLDACRDNPLPATSRGVKRGLAVEAERRELLIAFSTDPGKTADDGPAGSHSPFAAALAEELDVPGLEATALFKVVTKKVMDATKGDQMPWVTQRLIDDFYFRPSQINGPTPAAAAAAAVTAPSPASVPAGAPGTATASQATPPERGAAAAEIAYGQAVIANTTDAYETWLRQFPDSDRKASVLSLLQRLREEELWRRATTAATVQDQMRALDIELLAFPVGIYAEKARVKLASLQTTEKPPAPVEPAVVPPSPEAGARRIAGKDAYGNDRGGFILGVVSVDACEGMCKTDSGCVGYTYNIRRQACILKNAVSSLVDAREPAITGIFDNRAPAPASTSLSGAETFRYYEDTDAPNNDLEGFLSGMDLEACERFCLARTDCVGYTYNRKRSVCIPKARIGKLAHSREPALTGILESRR